MKILRGVEIVRQGEKGSDVYVILDGAVRIERDGERTAEYGPGALLGERAQFEDGVRTPTIPAVTTCRVATVPADALDRGALQRLSSDHHQEETEV